MNKKKKKLYYNNIMNHSIVVQELYQRLTRQSGSGPAEDKLVEGIITDIRGLVSLEKVKANIKSITDKIKDLEERESVILNELKNKEDMAQGALAAKTIAYDELLENHKQSTSNHKMAAAALEALKKDTESLKQELELIKKEKELIKIERDQLLKDITSKEVELQKSMQEIQQLKTHLQSIRDETNRAQSKGLS
jgi:chromosome segregation ATPase